MIWVHNFVWPNWRVGRGWIRLGEQSSWWAWRDPTTSAVITEAQPMFTFGPIGSHPATELTTGTDLLREVDPPTCQKFKRWES